jgi:hypothetical protein
LYPRRYSRLINRQHSICRLFLNIDLQEKFSALICHPRRRKYTGIHLQTGRWVALDLCKTQNLPLIVKDHYELFMCIFDYVYN